MRELLRICAKQNKKKFHLSTSVVIIIIRSSNVVALLCEKISIFFHLSSCCSSLLSFLPLHFHSSSPLFTSKIISFISQMKFSIFYSNIHSLSILYVCFAVYCMHDNLMARKLPMKNAPNNFFLQQCKE